MLVFSNDQLQAMAETTRDEFIDGVLSRLRALHPESVKHLDDQALLDETREAIGNAGHYGLSLRSTVTRFVVLRFAHGADFDQSREVCSLLLDAASSETDRVSRVERLLGASAVPRRVVS